MTSPDWYLVVKTAHILSSTILFGTGVGIAFFFWLPHARGLDVHARLAAASTTVVADFVFTLPMVIVQPVTGLWLVWQGGYRWFDSWLTASYVLYLVAGICWMPVVIIQLALRRMLIRKSAGETIDQARYDRLFRWWFLLGWPAFSGLVVIFFLMVAKPTW